MKVEERARNHQQVKARSERKQTNGTSMGSPVSVVVANLVMEEIEERAISEYPITDNCIIVETSEIKIFILSTSVGNK